MNENISVDKGVTVASFEPTTGRVNIPGKVYFTELNKQHPLCISFCSPDSGKKIGELKEIDGVFTFEGEADEAARIFFNELSKISINPKK